MKVIFLDFNGVLDNSENYNIVDEENLNILKEIIDETGAKVVVSSSIKNTYFYAGHHNRVMEYLIDVLTENNIEIYGLTPWLKNREKEIQDYLEKNPDISEYCIIDDDFYFESMKEHMVKLKHQLLGGNGLKEIDKNQIIKILKRWFNYDL